MAMIRRSFADFSEGQMHYRHSGTTNGNTLVMLHASPGSSLMLNPIIAAMGDHRRVIAPDNLHQ
jgi:pimeloyl-ACP methyl ester carboxylesterase